MSYLVKTDGEPDKEFTSPYLALSYCTGELSLNIMDVDYQLLVLALDTKGYEILTNGSKSFTVLKTKGQSISDIIEAQNRSNALSYVLPNHPTLKDWITLYQHFQVLQKQIKDEN